jgi:hypothetical protein
VPQLIDQFEQNKGDWTKAPPERPKMPNERPPSPKPSLDSMIGFTGAMELFLNSSVKTSVKY